jgi:UDP-3-O-[3-hydroxymyristoyl] glucosamine N-acyltransferase
MTPITLSELGARTGGEVRGEGSTRVFGLAALEDAGPGDLTFAAGARFRARLAASRASAAIVTEDLSAGLGIPHLVHRDPDEAMTTAAAIFFPDPPPPAPGVHASAVVGAGVVLADGVSIGPLVVLEDRVRVGARTSIGAGGFVGSDTTIGEDCRFHPNVTIRDRVAIGSRVILHPGAVIGADGFGFRPVAGGFEKIPQRGTVVIEDDVEIGANATVDRARFARTWIRRGTKIDNLVQIGHNVVIGEGSILVAQAGIAGSTRLGARVQVGPQAGLLGHLHVGDGARIAGQSGVPNDLEAGAEVFGSPATNRREFVESLRSPRKIERVEREIRELRERLDRVEKNAANPPNGGDR